MRSLRAGLVLRLRGHRRPVPSDTSDGSTCSLAAQAGAATPTAMAASTGAASAANEIFLFAVVFMVFVALLWSFGLTG